MTSRLIRAWSELQTRNGTTITGTNLLTASDIYTRVELDNMFNEYYTKLDLQTEFESEVDWGNLVNVPAGVDGGQVLFVQDNKTSGSHGGTFTNGAWRTRDLNTVSYNGISGASLASNQITLPLGNYLIQARCPSYQVGYHVARVYDITNAVLLVQGGSWNFSQTGGSGEMDAYARADGVFTLTDEADIEIQHRCQITIATLGFGLEVNSTIAVPNEVYTTVVLWRF